MATFSAAVRGAKEYNQVYIRISHSGQPGYIKTNLIVHRSGIRKGKIVSPAVLAEAAIIIKSYYEKMSGINISVWTVQELKEYLLSDKKDVSFTDFAEKRIRQLYNEGKRNHVNYRAALNNLQQHFGKKGILFSELTSKVIQAWIDSMRESSRKKSLYPSIVKAIINAAIKEYNDYENNIIPIRFNPFLRVKIPKDRTPEKRSVDVDIVRNVLTSHIAYPVNYDDISRREIGRDIAMMIFCLAGINAADLYDLKDVSLKKSWKLCYKRKKTRDKSDTGAYTEITVPEMIRPLFEKYKGVKGSLFMFSERYTDCIGFVKNVNKGLKAICEDIGVEKVTTYTFRHSWATIAQNNCGASTEMVAFALNHASVHKITEGYIRKDYTPIDVLNQKVIEYVFLDKKHKDKRKNPLKR